MDFHTLNSAFSPGHLNRMGLHIEERIIKNLRKVPGEFSRSLESFKFLEFVDFYKTRVLPKLTPQHVVPILSWEYVM